jgi:branched-chain amino acid transport system substrate-binding protein
MTMLRLVGGGVLLLLCSVQFAAAQELAIGAILPLSGPSATQGEDQRRGLELAVERVNAEGGVLGRPIRVVVEDSGGRAPTALDAAKKLVSVNAVPVVVGEFSSGITLPVGQYVVREGRVHINIASSSGRLRAIGEGSFGVIGLDNVTTSFAAKDVYDNGWRKVGFIAPNNAFGQGVSEQFKKYFEELGGQVTLSVLYPDGQTTYRRELQQLETASPDVYVYSAYGKDAAVVNREAFELGLNRKPWYGIYLSMNTADSSPQFVSGQWGMDTNFVGTGGQAYEAAYQKKFGHPFKTTYSGYAYDAVMLVVAAAKKAGSIEPVALRNAIRELGSTYEGVTGLVAFDKDGQRSAQPYLKLKYTDGAVTKR